MRKDRTLRSRVFICQKHSCILSHSWIQPKPHNVCSEVGSAHWAGLLLIHTHFGQNQLHCKHCSAQPTCQILCAFFTKSFSSSYLHLFSSSNECNEQNISYNLLKTRIFTTNSISCILRIICRFSYPRMFRSFNKF